MSETAENKESASVASIRETVRSDVQSARLKHRHDEVDSLRVAPHELQDYSINLQTFNQEDVLGIVKIIKKHKHAKSTELLKLSQHNIQCFLNTTGAMNVIIKELTGSDSEKQVLAVECLCNLTLGSEVLCEKVALQAGTYLHTFLTSSNEELQRTSLWCLTNLIAGGRKPLAVLLNQELVTGLINLHTNTHSDQIRREVDAAIVRVIDIGDKSILRTSDISSLSHWTFNQKDPYWSKLQTTVIYKMLGTLDYQIFDPKIKLNIFATCFDTLVELNETPRPYPVAQHLILLTRICSNMIAMDETLGNYIVKNWFSSGKRSMSVFLNLILQTMRAENFSVDEVFWFIDNLTSCRIDGELSEFMDLDEIFTNLEIN